MLIYAPLTMLTFFVPPLPRYRFIRQWGRFNIWWLKVTCNLAYTVEGREHLPNIPSVILAKHQSTWETLAFQFLFPPHVWILKRDLLWIPFFGWGLYMTQPIAINRGAFKKAVGHILEQGQQRLRTGRWILVFPEGTRMPVGQQRRFGKSGALLASTAGCAIVPVAHNAGSYWPRRGFIKHPGTIRVVIGPSITTSGRGADEITQQAEAWMETTMTELEERTQIRIAH